MRKARQTTGDYYQLRESAPCREQFVIQYDMNRIIITCPDFSEKLFNICGVPPPPPGV
jgi:hypothetical protein